MSEELKKKIDYILENDLNNLSVDELIMLKKILVFYENFEKTPDKIKTIKDVF